MSNPSSQIYQTPLTEVTTVQKEVLGSLRWHKNKCYKYVKLRNNTATVAGVAGDVASYRADQYDNNVVVLDQTDADTVSIPAGVVQGAVAGVLLTDYFLWVQIKGFATLNGALGGTPAVGDELTMTTVDKIAQRRTYAGTTPAIAANGGLLGTVMHVANKEVILNAVY